MTIDSPLEWIDEGLERLREEHRLREARVVVPVGAGRCCVNGRELWDFASNDYLGLADDERLISAARNAIADSSGLGARASALVCGRTDWHERVETRLAQFEQTQAALLFPTGYAANLGTIPALVGMGDAVFCDRLNHASLVDGCRLSRAKFHVYPHNDTARLDQLLIKAEAAPRKLIVTDSVFSMDGDAAPLAELHRLSQVHHAMLMMDEAHATGLHGARGTGMTEACGIDDPAVIKVGTLSKAVGCQGGYVCGTQPLIDWLRNNARTQMFSTALSPMLCAAVVAAIDVIETEPEKRTRLLTVSHRFRERLTDAGLAIPAGVIGPIVPLIVGDADRTMRLAADLQSTGFLVGAIRPPTVPQGTSRLRISLSAVHPAEAIDELAEWLITQLAH